MTSRVSGAGLYPHSVRETPRSVALLRMTSAKAFATAVTRSSVRRFVTCLLVPVLLLAARAGSQSYDPRDRWQRPQEVMDALGVQPGSRVADIGAGEGYFTWHLAERVGLHGRVYATDIDKRLLSNLRADAKRKRFPQVEVVLGVPDDPHLPTGEIDAALVVNAYHEFRQHEAMLRGILKALRPGGKLAIIDKEAEPGQGRSHYYSAHRIPKQLVRTEAESAGFRYMEECPGFTRPDDQSRWYFLLFEKPQ